MKKSGNPVGVPQHVFKLFRIVTIKLDLYFQMGKISSSGVTGKKARFNVNLPNHSLSFSSKVGHLYVFFYSFKHKFHFKICQDLEIGNLKSHEILLVCLSRKIHQTMLWHHKAQFSLSWLSLWCCILVGIWRPKAWLYLVFSSTRTI